MAAPTDRKALLLLLFGASVIGAGTTLVRLTGVGPAAAGFWRLAFAVPFLVMLTGWERRRGQVTRGLGAPIATLALCALTFAMDLACWHYSLGLTSIATSTVLANMTPVIVTVLAWLLFRERPTPMFMLGLALALTGGGVMAAARGGAPGPSPMLGDSLALAASCCYAGYFLAVRRARRTASALQVMLASSLLGVPLMLMAALIAGERIWPVSASGWRACAALGLMHVFGQGTIAYGLGKVPTAVAAVAVLVQPLVASAAAWLVFGQAIGPLQALGGLLALCGIAFAQAARRVPPPIIGEAEAAA